MRKFIATKLEIPDALSIHIPLWLLIGCLITRRLGAESLETRLMGIVVERSIMAVRYSVQMDSATQHVLEGVHG